MNLLAELKRRNVFRAALLYIGVAWALAQGAAQLLPVFDVPNGIVRGCVVAGIIGFPVWLVFAWFYELTPEGLKRESEIAPDASIRRTTARKLDLAIIAVLAVAVVLLLTDRWAMHRTAPDRAVSDKSIAVLPLVNTSGDPSNEYFSDGMSEELINTLGKLRDLTVIGRNSSFQFKGKAEDSKAIAAKLGVAYLLEGSVRKASDRVRIAVDLVKASSGANVWSDTFDRDLKDIFAVQTEIATAVAAQLQSVLVKGSVAQPAAIQPESPPGGNVEAYTAYLQGKFYEFRNSEEDLGRAIGFYKEAVRIAPQYAEAWARLGRTTTTLTANFVGGQVSSDGYTSARVAINTALRLAPELAVAHAARCYLLTAADFDFRGAETECRYAVALAPNDGEAKGSLAQVLQTLGHVTQALELRRAALVIDPVRARFHSELGNALYSLGRLDEAERAVRKAVELEPQGNFGRLRLTFIDVRHNRPEEALAQAQQVSPGSAWNRVAVALATQIGVDRGAADAALQTLVDHDAEGMGYQIAEIYALRAEPDKMFEWLNRAWSQRDPGLTFLLYDPLTLRFKSDPRYAALVGKVGLPVENLASTDVVAMPMVKPAPTSGAP